MSTTKILSIVGAGGHGQVIADAAQLSGHWAEIRFFDDTKRREDLETIWPVVGTISNLLSMSPPANHEVVVGFGNNEIRLVYHKKFSVLGWKMATVFHPSAIISPRAKVLAGTVVMAGVVINIGTLVDEACIINTRASIDHDCKLGQGVHISPGAVLAGTVDVDVRAWIGVGSVVKDGLQIGEDSILGAGSTAIGDITAGTVAVGSPAKSITAYDRLSVV